VTQALLIFKPDASYRRAVRGRIWDWLQHQEGVEVTTLEWFQAPPSLVESHYDFLRGRPFFPWLVDFMSALPLVVGRISANPATLEQLRFGLGETRIHESRPDSLRGKFGIFGGINVLHVSDSPESGEKEVALWAPHLKATGIEANPSDGATGPDHTYELRSLANLLSAGQHVAVATLEIKRLLQEETALTGDQLTAFDRIMLGAFA
jgi:nucleoside-diphosphate kinase